MKLARTILAVLWIWNGPAASAADTSFPPRPQEPGKVAFPGSGQNTILAMAADASGNIVVAGTTSSPDLPVINAAQPSFAEAGVLRTTDNGVTWTSAGRPPDNISVVTPDPIDPQTLFAAGSLGIYKTSDGGRNWRKVYSLTSMSPFNMPPLNSLVVDPANRMHVAATGQQVNLLLLSLDSGETWAPSSIRLGGGQLAVDPTGSGALLAYGSLLLVSRDWGSTFVSVVSPSSGYVDAAAFDAFHQGWLYVALGAAPFPPSSFPPASIWLSTDFGDTWTSKTYPQTSPPELIYLESLTGDPDQPGTLVAGIGSLLFKSTDGAVSWNLESSWNSYDVRSFMFQRQSCGGGIFANVFQPFLLNGVAYSADDGVTWQTPRLTAVTDVSTGPGCAAYSARLPSTDAFVSKVTPGGKVLWTTFLGGADQDTVAGIAVDAEGNAYIAGTTFSTDFPATLPHIGVSGTSSAFLTKFDADGDISFSVQIGGEAQNSASGLAVDSDGNAYIIGNTTSTAFPVTPGTLNVNAGPNQGFLAKISPNGSLVYATYLSATPVSPTAIFVGADNRPIIGGIGPWPGPRAPEFVLMLDQYASSVLQATYLPGVMASDYFVPGATIFYGPSALATDTGGNLIVMGSTYVGSGVMPPPGGYISPPLDPGAVCKFPASYGGDLYIAKLSPDNWNPVYMALIRSDCGIQPGAMSLAPSGAIVFSGATTHVGELIRAAESCGNSSGWIGELTPNGAELKFGMFLNGCGPPAVALGQNGSIYASTSVGSSAEVISVSARARNPQD